MLDHPSPPSPTNKGYVRATNQTKAELNTSYWSGWDSYISSSPNEEIRAERMIQKITHACIPRRYLWGGYDLFG